MPIKLNGTTIFDESDFADKDLSNLSASGAQVISNAVSAAMSNISMLKRIDYDNSIDFTVNKIKTSTSTSHTDYTILEDGYIMIKSFVLNSNTSNNTMAYKINSSLIYCGGILPDSGASGTGTYYPSSFVLIQVSKNDVISVDNLDVQQILNSSVTMNGTFYPEKS